MYGNRFVVPFTVGVTGNALPDEIADFMAHGADEVLTKPITKAALISAILARCT